MGASREAGQVGEASHLALYNNTKSTLSWSFFINVTTASRSRSWLVESGFIFEKLGPQLEAKGYSISIAPLVSTGVAYSPPPAHTPSLHDDEAAIRKVIEPLVESGKDVVIVAHSAGGYISAGAVQGLCKPKRKQSGKTGGVVYFVFYCAGIAPIGFKHTPERPFADYQVNYGLNTHYEINGVKTLFAFKGQRHVMQNSSRSSVQWFLRRRSGQVHRQNGNSTRRWLCGNRRRSRLCRVGGSTELILDMRERSYVTGRTPAALCSGRK